MGNNNKSRFADSLAIMSQARTNPPAATPAEGPGAVAPTPAPTSAPAPPRPGRTGKKNDPDYTQVNGYVRRDLYKRVRLALIEDDRELGELMEQLLSEWLAERERNR